MQHMSSLLAFHGFGAGPVVYPSQYRTSQHNDSTFPHHLHAINRNLPLQVDDGSWAHMVHAYVHLQEGNIVEGEQNITNAMKAALIRRANDACYTILYYTILHYTTLHYTTLHYTTLHYTTLHYTTLHYTAPGYRQSWPGYRQSWP